MHIPSMCIYASMHVAFSLKQGFQLDNNKFASPRRKEDTLQAERRRYKAGEKEREEECVFRIICECAIV